MGNAASVNFLDGTHIEQDRIVLAVYPISYVLPSLSLYSIVLTSNGHTQVVLLYPRVDDSHSVAQLGDYCKNGMQCGLCSSVSALATTCE